MKVTQVIIYKRLFSSLKAKKKDSQCDSNISVITEFQQRKYHFEHCLEIMAQTTFVFVLYVSKQTLL